MVGSARWSDCKCVSASDLSCSLLVIFTAVGVANDDDVMIPSTVVVVIVIGCDGGAGAGAGAGGSLFCHCSVVKEKARHRQLCASGE